MGERNAETVAIPAALRVVVVLLWMESLALVGAGALLIIKTITGRPADLARALLGAALALVAAATLAYGARALRQLRPAGQSPIMVLQLLALPVGYNLAFDAGQLAYGAPVMVVALVVLFLLFSPPVRAVLYRDPPR